jgi:hypothetical protein
VRRGQSIRWRGPRWARVALLASMLAGASLAFGTAAAGALPVVSYTTPGEYVMLSMKDAAGKAKTTRVAITLIR